MPSTTRIDGVWAKTCPRCDSVFKATAKLYLDAISELEQFFNRGYGKGGNRDGLHSYCRSCARDANVGRDNKTHRDTLLQAQSNSCAICAAEISFTRNNAALDHDHKTNKTREVICIRCNNWMAGIDNDEWLAKAMAYRNKHRG